MTQKEFERAYRVRLVSKKDSLFMRFLGFILRPFCPDFMWNFFTTIRLPFGPATIYHPDCNPMAYRHILYHELLHVEQQRSAWGLLKSYLLGTIFPLPLFFSGRWYLERDAYLRDINLGYINVDEAVGILWGSYGYCWPKAWMRKWFEERLS